MLIKILNRAGWPQHGALGTRTCHQPPTGCNSTQHRSSGSAVRPVSYPTQNAPAPATAAGSSGRCCGRAWQRLYEGPGTPPQPPPRPLRDSPCHRRRSVSLAGPAFHNPVLAGPDPPAVLHNSTPSSPSLSSRQSKHSLAQRATASSLACPFRRVDSHPLQHSSCASHPTAPP